jgi:hypothetical protein
MNIPANTPAEAVAEIAKWLDDEAAKDQANADNKNFSRTFRAASGRCAITLRTSANVLRNATIVPRTVTVEDIDRQFSAINAPMKGNNL